MAVAAREAVPNVALYNLRDAAGLSQQELADGLNELAQRQGLSWSCTAQTVSRWERGIVERPDPVARRLLGSFFDVPLAELGFTRPKLHRQAGSPEDDPLVVQCEPAGDGAPRVVENQRCWTSTRRALNAHRHALTHAAVRLYPESVRMGDTGLLAHPAWQPPAPVELTAIDLTFRSSAPPAQITGREPEAAPQLPWLSEHQRYTRYSHAIRDLVAPRLFENRLSYRLLDLDWSGSTGAMTFGDTTYFEEVDTLELLAHEMAAAHVHGDGTDLTIGQPSWRRLAWRRLVEDPFDLARRVFLPSIDTLTLRMSPSGSPSMVLHQRDSASVAVAGALLHVMPCGVFQPSNVLPEARAADFSLWRNVMREYSEEFLGNPEHDGGGAAIDYDALEPFRSLEQARREGRLRIYCLGVALDALTLATEILTVAVIDADVYDTVFAGMVTTNSEGHVAAATAPFEEHTLRRLLTSGKYQLAPAAAGCLELAWQHRRVVLDRS